MATYVKGNAVENAISYELFEKVGNAYNLLADASEINFEVSAMGLEAGDHILVVKAKAAGFADSPYSNEVVFTVPAGSTVVTKSYNTTGSYIAIADGAEVTSTSWIHSDLIDITTLTNNTDGFCTSNLQGHAKVANIAYYGSNDLSAYISGIGQDAGAIKQFTADEILSSAPDGATYVCFSTHSSQVPLQVTVME